MDATKKQMPLNHIIFFDGVCHLCNGFVDFLISRDHQRRLLFAPLQGETAARLLSPEMRQKLESVVYVEDGHHHIQSDAVLQGLARLGGAYRLALGLKILPRSLRNFLYHWIARNRYLWFGKKEMCRLPMAHEKDYLLP